MVDILESMRAEHAEAVELLRQAFPHMSEEGLHGEAATLCTDRYVRGRYLTIPEMQRQWPPKPYDKWGAK